mmetsp:Transcript_28125/g.61718  ORF Transcript_28125/g.61718 Transcript_28125/m.61718 type:complete len:262 (+) Transcript_28125:1676-2461(+)
MLRHHPCISCSSSNQAAALAAAAAAEEDPRNGCQPGCRVVHHHQAGRHRDTQGISTGRLHCLLRQGEINGRHILLHISHHRLLLVLLLLLLVISDVSLSLFEHCHTQLAVQAVVEGQRSPGHLRTLLLHLQHLAHNLLIVRLHAADSSYLRLSGCSRHLLLLLDLLQALLEEGEGLVLRQGHLHTVHNASHLDLEVKVVSGGRHHLRNWGGGGTSRTGGWWCCSLSCCIYISHHHSMGHRQSLPNGSHHCLRCLGCSLGDC